MCRDICHVRSWGGVRRTGPFTVFVLGVLSPMAVTATVSRER